MSGRFRYSWSNFVNGAEEIDTTLRRLAESGYDGIEVVGEPDRYDAPALRKRVGSFGLEVSSIGSIFSAERDFSSPDPDVRSNAERYVDSVCAFAVELGAPVAIFAPASCMRTSSSAETIEEDGWMLDGMRRAAEHARVAGVDLAIEAWNRYETYKLNRVDQAVALARMIDVPNVGVMADVFHMNIEEDSIAAGIRRAGSLLMHVHLSDSNRSVPGSGHVDFADILTALDDIGYEGYLTFELIPAAADPIAVLETGGAEEFRTAFAREAVAHLRSVEAQTLAPEAQQ